MSFKTYIPEIVTTDIPLDDLGFGQGKAKPAVAITAGVPYLAGLRTEPLAPFPIPEIEIVSSDPETADATVDINFNVTIQGRKPGKATITATCGKLETSIDVTILEPLPIVKKRAAPVPLIPATAIELTYDTKEITPLLQFDLGASLIPSNANEGSVVWLSDDADIAEIADIGGQENRTGVNRYGRVATIRGVSPGTTNVTAIIGAVSASCLVTVV
jgi:uncharacterized protein YjdB